MSKLLVSRKLFGPEESRFSVEENIDSGPVTVSVGVDLNAPRVNLDFLQLTLIVTGPEGSSTTVYPENGRLLSTDQPLLFSKSFPQWSVGSTYEVEVHYDFNGKVSILNRTVVVPPPPSPYPSWSWSQSELHWVPPIPAPDPTYVWDQVAYEEGANPWKLLSMDTVNTENEPHQENPETIGQGTQASG